MPLQVSGPSRRCPVSACSARVLDRLGDEDVLQRDHVGLHPQHLGDVGDAAGAVDQARDLHDQVEGARDLLADGAQRQVDAAGQHQRLDTGQGVTRVVGVDGGQRAVVAGVHGLQHVHGLGSTTLADDDAVGPHTQGVADEVADRDLALALDVGRARLQRDHVVLLELELGRVLDGDDALVGGDGRRQHVQRRRLTGAGTAGDEDVQLAAHAGLEELAGLVRERPELDQVGHRERVAAELPNGQRRSADRQRRDDRVHTRAVRADGRPRRRRLVDAPADAADDLVDDPQQVLVVDELRVRAR